MPTKMITTYQLAWNHNDQMGGLILTTDDGVETELAFRKSEFAAVTSLLKFSGLRYDQDNGVIMTGDINV